MWATLRASSLAVIIITLSLCRWTLAERDDFYDEKVVAPGVTAWLNCNNSTQFQSAPNFSMPVSWMLPNLTVLYGDEGRFRLLHDNWTLQISNVGTEDLGLYHCMLSAPGVEWFLLRIGLNAGGPYFEDLWDKYRLNTIIGLSAFFGFLLLAAAVILIYHFRYRPEDDDLSKQRSASTFDGLPSDSDGQVTVVSIVGKSSKLNMAYELDEKSPPSNEPSSTSSSEDTTVAAETYSVSNDNPQPTTQL